MTGNRVPRYQNHPTRSYGLLPGRPEDRNRNADQCQSRTRNPKRGNVLWKGIQHGEVHGPDHFTEVNDIGHEGVCGAQGERNLIKRADSTRPLLNEKRDDRRCGT